MDSEKMLFEKGCFLPSWIEDVEPQKEQIHLSRAYAPEHKDLNILLEELAQIKHHIEDVREREWNLAKMLHFHYNNFVKE